MKKKLLNFIRFLAVVCLFVFLPFARVDAQALSGTYSIPGNYASIEAAITALNLNGVNGPVVFNIGASSAYTESPSGTLVLGSALLNAGTSSTNTITFQRAASATANPLIYGYAGAKLASSTDSIDGIWAIVGTDYVTINGIDLLDPSSNTTPTTCMEYGYGLYKLSINDGANNNTIKNCVITLNRLNVTAASGARSNIAGSTGIDLVNSLRQTANTALVQTAISGSSSNNKFYSNTIQNVNIGIALAGSTVASPYTLADVNNDVGGNSLSTGNNLINFGGGTGAGAACAAVYVSNQYGSNVSYNNVDNNDGTGVNHPTSNRGIWLFANSIGASINVNNNTISIKGGTAVGSINWCIDMEMAQSGKNGNTLNINNNQFINCTSTPNSTAAHTAIWVNSAATRINVNGNTFTGHIYSGTGVSECILSQFAGMDTLFINNNIINSDSVYGASGNHYAIAVTAAPSLQLSISGNSINNVSLSALTSRIIRVIYVSTATSTCTHNISNNVFSNINYYGGTPSGEFTFIYGIGTAANYIINNNLLNGTFTIPSSGATYLIYNSQSTPNVTVANNNLSGSGITKTGTAGTFYAYYNFGSPSSGTANIVNNICSNITLSGTSAFDGFEYRTGTSQIIKISYNTVSNIIGGSGTKYGIYQGYGAVGSMIYNNNIYGMSGGGLIYGIFIGSVAPLGMDCFNNRVDSLVGTSSSIVYGIYNSLGSGVTNLFKNKVNNIINTNASGVAMGIHINAGTTFNIHNNLIGNILAPISNGTNQVIGLNLVAGTTANVYYNTIHLNATSTGTIFGSSGINMSASVTSIVLRNNIVSNLSTPNTSGYSVALRRASTVLTNYSTASNNNLYYAGTPGTYNLIYYDGTNSDQTISAFRSRMVTFEQASNTENPAYINTVGSSPDFLHLDLSVSTKAESGAVNISGFTFDTDSLIRQGNTGYIGSGTNPDIGADEGNFSGVAMVLDSVMVDQISSAVPINSTNQQVVAIRVHTSNSFSPFALTSLKLNTSGTSNVNDIQNAKVYFTGTSPVFNTSAQFGSTVAAPNGVYYINGNRLINPGVNYFWVTYDTKSTASANNFIDVRVDSLVIAGVNIAPVNGDPTGARKILAPLNGTCNVGLGQTYSTITAAIADLNALGVAGPVTFILKDVLYNTASGEVFPIVLNPYSGSSAVNTVTFRPDLGIYATIENSLASPAFDFNGISNVTFDGQPGGTGGFTSGNNLIISNTNNANPTIRFNNEASANKIIYCDLRGNNITATGTANAGVVNFGASSGVNGNDNILIKFCDIHENSAGNPTIGISSIGSAATVAANNDGIVIDSCKIYNFFNPTLATAGIYVGANNSTWTINGNKFFQTSTVTTTGTQTHRVMWVTPNVASLTSASGFVISNNYIGGNAANGSGTYTMNGTTSYQFYAMDISVGLGTATSVQNNTLTNFSLTSGFSGNGTYGINVANGNVNVGTITGNLIGSTTTNGAFTYTTTTTNGGFIAFRSGAGGTINFSNNIASGIDLISNNTTLYNSFNGIAGSGGANIIINNNTIGSLTLPNSINIMSTSATTTAASPARGIICNSSTSGVVNTITNNTIANINTNYSATGTQATTLVGIAVTTGTSTISGNVIKNLSSASQTTAGGSTCAINGISYTSTTAPVTITGNTISSLALTAASTTASIQAEGIFFAGPSSGTNIISRNLVQSMSYNAANPNVYLTGFDIASGIANIQNNMIRLGYDSNGVDIASPVIFRGVSKNSGSFNFYFNTVYIGGSGVTTGAVNTFAFQRTGSGTDIIRNNVFVNNRSNSGSTGKHYQVYTPNATTFTINNNIYYGNGTGAVFASQNGGTSDVLSYSSGWIASDLLSGVANPQFINATGSASSGDLHISASLPTPVESSGAAIAGITDDYDGQTRTSFSPTDIGADAGNFVAMDIFPPNFSTLTVSNTSSTADRIFTVNLTDVTGVPLTGSVQPRIYFKKYATGTWNSTAAVKLNGSAQNGNWEFTVSQSAMGGLSVSDSVYFYLIAQDSSSTNNLSSYPGGVLASDVNTVSVPPANLLSYKIVQGISGTINVGLGQTYTSLTAAGGLFEAINNGSITSNITAVITSDLLEDGTNGLNQINETGAGNYTVSIVPSGATERLIAGSYAGALIRLNGADRVKIDGRFAGSGKYLRIRNRVLNGFTIGLQNDAVRDTIRYCHIESVNNTVGTITFLGTNLTNGSGNDSNAIMYCTVRDTLGTLAANNIQNTGLFSQGTAGFGNDNNTFSYNEIFNFGYNGVNMSATSGDFWNISNNSFYQTFSKNNTIILLQIDGGTGYLITGNNIGGSNANRSGTPFTSGSTALQNIIGIRINNAVTTAQINNNIFSNIASPLGVNLIAISAGNVSISNNTFGGGAQSYDIIQNGYDNGIITITGGTVTVSNNLIGNVYYYLAAGDRTSGMTISGGTVIATGNTIRDIRSNSTGTGFTFLVNGIQISGGSNHIFEGNTIYNIVNTNTGTSAYTATGITLSSGTNVIIQRNRIYNIWGVGTGTGASSNQVFGLYIGNTLGTLVNNNQISIGNNTTGETRVYGIQDVASGGTNTYVGNSIFVNGTTLGGTNNSYCLQRTGLATVNSFNNIFYNNRSTTGTGANFTTGSASLTGVSPLVTNYNLYVANDTLKLAEGPTGFANTPSIFNTLYTGSNTYSSNWYALSANVPAQTFFTDTLNGNLGILNTNANCWYAHGKGIALAGFNKDFNNASRSVTITGGAVDLGSVEFSTSTTPPSAIASAAPAANTTTTYTFAGRQVASINWGSAGTLPSAVNVVYYTGVNAPNLIASKTQFNAYYTISPTGGSAYTYGIGLIADSATFGNVSGTNSSKIARYSGSTWNLVSNSFGNGTFGSLQTSTNSLSAFGTFTGTDNLNPLPVEWLKFTANGIGSDVLLNWSTASEKNNKGFTVERSADGHSFESVAFVKGAGNSEKIQNYRLIDNRAFEKMNSNALYYRIKQSDFDGELSYSSVVLVNNDNKADDQLSVFPNPFNSQLQIAVSGSKNEWVSIETLDIQGKVVDLKSVQLTENGLNLIPSNYPESLQSGVYFIRITGKDINEVRKIMKN